MIDTPASIMANRKATTTKVSIFVLAMPLIITDVDRVWQQQTETGQILPSDTTHYRNELPFGACQTNPAYLGNVSEAD